MEDGVRRAFTYAIILAASLGGFYLMAPLAHATEPRPWLCRDKPAVSDNKPMTYSAENRGGGQWVMTFMRFDPASGHDGFDVVSTQDVSGHVEGTLDPGQWYAVGLYREGSHWICAGPATENRQYVAGVVRDLCYGEDAGSCDVKLTVREAAPGH
jgi:hypothetical protein